MVNFIVQINLAVLCRKDQVFYGLERQTSRRFQDNKWLGIAPHGLVQLECVMTELLNNSYLRGHEIIEWHIRSMWYTRPKSHY